MSRSVNIDATVAHVTATCAKRSLSISAIEALHSGGTRVVMHNSVATAEITQAYGAKVMTGPVKRTPLRVTQLS